MDDEPKASFTGRLNMADFAFKDAPRRSPRLSRTGASSPAPTPTPSPSPSKRKATTDLPRPLSAPSLRQKPSPTPSSSGRASPRGKSRSRKASGYAPPSTYAHLRGLTDSLGPSLIVLFVGLNPGISTAQTGHAYAHPSNLFWKLLHSSGVTPRLVPPHEDKRMPGEYALGLTNIVERPSRNGAELSKAEMDAGVDVLGEKARECKAEVVCFVGKSIWESVWRVRKGRGIKKEEFRYGWQDEEEAYPPEGDWGGAKVFVASSTSGLAATLSPAEKEAIWRELGVYVERRRAERAAAEAEGRQEGVKPTDAVPEATL